jgi:CitMHS family citrate-Mg2+:H+ or citrate-Ca2+:H+ symporter
MLPVQIVGLIFVFGAAWWMGGARKTFAALPTIDREIVQATANHAADPLHRPRLFWLNLAITLAVIA